jgi:class 3 adenylate cyclase
MDQINAQNVKRKLAAILSADVEGYSRLMGEDEVGTIHNRAHRCTGCIENKSRRSFGL